MLIRASHNILLSHIFSLVPANYSDDYDESRGIYFWE